MLAHDSAPRFRFVHPDAGYPSSGVPIFSLGPSRRAIERWPETCGRAKPGPGFAFGWPDTESLWEWKADDFHPEDICRIFCEANHLLAIASIGVHRRAISIFLLNLGFPADAVLPPFLPPNNTTWLMVAAGNGSMEIVRLLIGNGANVSLEDIEGYSAERHALRAGHDEVAAYLATLREAKVLDEWLDAPLCKRRSLL